uniref:Ig-like domain-containing protein n=1 Tax=Strigamia maritima TaxID=126957 RepID=T1JI13_STRMM
QVSWVRHRDLHILTVGRYTYTTDQRYLPIHLEGSDDWNLQIKYPQKKDAGIYECQVSTEPKISTFVNLNVVDFLEELPPAPTKPPVRRTKSNPGG